MASEWLDGGAGCDQAKPAEYTTDSDQQKQLPE